MLGSYFDGEVPKATVRGAEADLPVLVADAVGRYDRLMLEVALTTALGAVWEIVTRANQYLVEKEPWQLAKDEGRRDELASVLYAAAETLRILAVVLSPIMPEAAARLWEQLGITEPLSAQRLPGDAGWGGLAAGTRAAKGDALFPRLDS